MPEFLEYIVRIIHTKFQLSISSSFSGKNSNFILRYGRFSEKGSKKSKNTNFLTFFFKQAGVYIMSILGFLFPSVLFPYILAFLYFPFNFFLYFPVHVRSANKACIVHAWNSDSHYHASAISMSHDA